jgi:S-adenosyl-L-methionine hydrolase (adenosine-forming)
MRARPVITLLTDFGSVDPYVGMMKGVIAGICPDANVVDISHDVPAQDIATGAFFLERTFRYFPPGTVHVAVVDPGVGTSRAALALRAEGHVFIGPDNGVLSLAARRGQAVALRRTSYFRPIISQTFHGRDIFAPVAAHVANGTALQSLGPPTQPRVKLPSLRPRRTRTGICGAIVSVDRFGNLITNLDDASWQSVRRPRLSAATFDFTQLAPNYQAVRRGDLAAVVGGYGLIEIAARNASAAKILGLGVGDSVRLLAR